MVRSTRTALSFTLAVVWLSVAAATAWAAPPPNDAKNDATLIADVPFTDTIDTVEATIGPEDDAAAEACGLAETYPRSVWYRYTPSVDQVLVVGTEGSSYSVGVGIGTADYCVMAGPGPATFWAMAGETYWIAFVDIGAGGAGGSLQVSVDVNHAPVCDDIAVSVQADQWVKVPVPACTDPDGDLVDLYTVDEPAHGVFDYLKRYTPFPGFTGTDSMTYRALDWWGAESEPARINITVTKAPNTPASPQSAPNTYQGSPRRDVTAPTLDLLAPSSPTVRAALRRGIRLAATTSEAGHLSVRAFVSRKTARRLKIKKNAKGAVVVGSLRRGVAAGKTMVTLRLTDKARSRLKRATRVKLRIVATITDSAKNVREETLRVTLKQQRSR